MTTIFQSSTNIGFNGMVVDCDVGDTYMANVHAATFEFAPLRLS